MLAPDTPPSPKVAALIAAGHLGRKSGRGFYDYASGKPGSTRPGRFRPGWPSA